MVFPCLLPDRFHTVRHAGGETRLLPGVSVAPPPPPQPADASFSPQVVGLLLPNQTLASTIFWQVPQPPHLPLHLLKGHSGVTGVSRSQGEAPPSPFRYLVFTFHLKNIFDVFMNMFDVHIYAYAVYTSVCEIQYICTSLVFFPSSG